MRLGSDEMKLLDSQVCIGGRSAPMDMGVVMREKESSVINGSASAPACSPRTGDRPKEATRDATPSISSRSTGTDIVGAAGLETDVGAGVVSTSWAADSGSGGATASTEGSAATSSAPALADAAFRRNGHRIPNGIL
jgi:hypothetical protein